MSCTRHLCWGIFEPCICCTAIWKHLEMGSQKSQLHLGLRHVTLQPVLHRDVSSWPRCSVERCLSSAAATPGSLSTPSITGVAWEKQENQSAAHFKKPVCFSSLEINFLCFPSTMKMPNKHQINKKKFKSSVSFFL